VKLRTLVCSTLMGSLALVAGWGQTKPAAAAPATPIPRLQKHGTGHHTGGGTGKPFLALAGELHNNSAHQPGVYEAAVGQDRGVQTQHRSGGRFLGPDRTRGGQIDFSVLDGVIQGARAQKLRLVLLWFGTWKNGLSSYPPNWVKMDSDRFPARPTVREDTPWPVFGGPRFRVNGNLSMELMSPSAKPPETPNAKAFAAIDAAYQGIRWASAHRHRNPGGERNGNTGRHPRPLARGHQGLRRAGSQGELMDYLQQHKSTLIPAP